MGCQFTVLIEKDGDGLEELFKRIKEVIELCVEEQGLPSVKKQFIGLHQLELEL